MWKQLLLWLLKLALDAVYGYIDKDKDGKLSKEELDSIVSLLRSYASTIRKKNR